MAVDPLVANRYAEALFNRAQETQALDAVAEAAQGAVELVQPGTGLRRFLENPQVSKQTKQQLVERTLGERIPQLLLHFLLLLIERGRADHVEDALEGFLLLVQEDRGVYPASVVTAVALDEADCTQMKQTLQQHTGKTLDIDFVVDPKILGGVVFRYRDELIDASLRGGLNDLKARLKPLKVH